MITLSPAHAAARSAAALVATLALLNSGSTGAVIQLYGTERPANGAAAGGVAMAGIVLPKPAGTIADGVLTLATAPDAMIYITGDVVWARIEVSGSASLDCDVSDINGTATIRLATTRLYAGGLVRMAAGVLS